MAMQTIPITIFPTMLCKLIMVIFRIILCIQIPSIAIYLITQLVLLNNQKHCTSMLLKFKICETTNKCKHSNKSIHFIQLLLFYQQQLLIRTRLTVSLLAYRPGPFQFDSTKIDSQSKDVGSKVLDSTKKDSRREYIGSINSQVKEVFLFIQIEYNQLIHIGPSVTVPLPTCLPVYMPVCLTAFLSA